MILSDVVVCAKTFVFFFETGSKSESSECISKAIHQRLRCNGMYAATAASSGNSISLIILYFTFVFPFKREGLNIFLSVRVCRYTPFFAVPKGRLRSSEKKTPNSVG